MEDHEFENNDYLKNVLESFDSMIDLHDSPYFQFLRAQLQLLLCSPKARRFDKQNLVLAAELYSISPAAYKMLRRSGALALTLRHHNETNYFQEVFRMQTFLLFFRNRNLSNV